MPARDSVITEAEWFAALGAAEGGADGVTTTELADLLQTSHSSALKLLHKALKNKKIVVGRGQRVRIDGAACTVPVYKLTKKEK
jgi:hypothetical protein